MNKQHICKHCKHWKKDDFYVGFGSCELIKDMSEDITYKGKDKMKIDKAYTSDYEGYQSFNYTGSDFGCIHWKWGYNNDD